MKRKLISKIIVVALSFTIGATTLTSSKTVNASTLITAQEILDSMTELESDDYNIKMWEVIDEYGVIHYLSMNYETHTLNIDDELINFDVEEVSMPKATVDYSTAAGMSGKVPWKGSTTLLAAAITAVISGGAAAGWVVRSNKTILKKKD